MPRKPTIYVKMARDGILSLIENHPQNEALPTLRELGEQFTLHPSTIYRLLCDLETEGLIWQGPSGRFFAASAQRHTLREAPLCFIGREMWHWSQLYQEILEGVAEVCSANGSPLIFHSAPNLVRVPVHLDPPIFASAHIQKKELQKLAATIPRGCAGILFDHLWRDVALQSATFPGGQKLQLLFGSGKYIKTFMPDYAVGAEMIARHVQAKAFDQVCLVVPFEGDPVILECLQQLRIHLKSFDLREVAFHDHEALKEIITHPHEHSCLICPEDNITLGLAELVSKNPPPPGKCPIEILATQGLGVVTSPHTRLRYDYRRLGRAAAAHIFHGTSMKPVRPHLITLADEED